MLSQASVVCLNSQQIVGRKLRFNTKYSVRGKNTEIYSISFMVSYSSNAVGNRVGIKFVTKSWIAL